jgi:hypothetical protein
MGSLTCGPMAPFQARGQAEEDELQMAMGGHSIL